MNKKHIQYRIGQHAGKPAFLQDGQPVVLPSYCTCGPSFPNYADAIRRFARHGCSIFWLMPTGGYNGEWGTSPFWTAPGQINDPPAAMPEGYFGLDQQAKLVLSLVPEARFFVRMMDMPPESWAAANAGDMLLNYRGDRYPIPSYASERYLTEASAFLSALARYCERQSWAERVIGYVVYPLGEGATPLAGEGCLFDQSPVMQQAFRTSLRRKYGADAALREAWGDSAVTLDTAAVPGDLDFRKRGEKPVHFWPEAKQVQRELDYFECQGPLFRRYYEAAIAAFRTAAPDRLVGFDAFKGNMLGWMTHPMFSGAKWREHYGDQFLATGTTGMADLLDLSGLDIIATPHDYRCRWAGFGYDPEGIGDSIQLHGKIMMVEEDQRSYANNERGLFGSIEPGEEEAVLYRNLAASLSKGQQTYPMDVCVGYFEAEPIQEILEKRAAIERQFLNLPRQDVPSMTMLVDDRAARYTDFSAEYNDLAVIRQRIGGMNHCGVPTRTFLWDDLARANFPACHKLFLLPNCYRYGSDVLGMLKSRLFRDGNVIVFGPGSGITDGATLSPDFAAALMGMDFELYDYTYPRFVTLDNWTHPLTAGVGACESYGDTHRYGPVLVPLDRAAPACTGGNKFRTGLAADPRPFVRLGTIPLDNGKRRPGLVVKEFGKGAAGNGTPGPRGAGDYAVVFTAAVPLPAKLLRNLARFSGTHVYDDEDDVVYADSTMVAVHAVKPGPRRIALSRRCEVHDVVSGQAVGEGLSEIVFDVTQPVTRWFGIR
jgi:hypothetical protein